MDKTAFSVATLAEHTQESSEIEDSISPNPDNCHMPDLSGLDHALIPALMLNVLVGGDPSMTEKGGLYRNNFVRLVVQALDEYKKARVALIELSLKNSADTVETLLTGGDSAFLHLIQHLENCVNVTSRLLKILEKIKSERGAFEIPRQVRREIESYSGKVNSIRNSVEHMDEKIQRGETSEGPIMLSVGTQRDRAIIADQHILFADLAWTLRKLYEVAHCLL